MLSRYQLLTVSFLLFSAEAGAQSPAPQPAQPQQLPADTARQRPLRLISAHLPLPDGPLYVVNGQPMSASFQPTDIPARYIKETKVLTGTQAQAIGGARAANGLVLITTKRRYKPATN